MQHAGGAYPCTGNARFLAHPRAASVYLRRKVTTLAQTNPSMPRSGCLLPRCTPRRVCVSWLSRSLRLVVFASAFAREISKFTREKKTIQVHALALLVCRCRRTRHPSMLDRFLMANLICRQGHFLVSVPTALSRTAKVVFPFSAELSCRHHRSSSP